MDVDACGAQCLADGHCCVGATSSYNLPSCANGCALAGAGVTTYAACAGLCARARAADCKFSHKNVSIDMCSDCPAGCDATGPSECEDGCRIAFHKPPPPPPPPCGEGGPCWDSGRYSESKVVYDAPTGLFHLFATASAVGGNASTANKIVEQIGWAVSDDGIHFTEHAHNPVGPQLSGAPPDAHGEHWATTPLTSAMAEGHAVLNGSLVYVFHTIRWSGDGDPSFCPAPRNGEDLGVQIFTASPAFQLEFPIVTPHWQLTLRAGERAPCRYDKARYRFCASLKTELHSSATDKVIKPDLSFRVDAAVGAARGGGGGGGGGGDEAGRAVDVVNASVIVSVFHDYGKVGKVLATLPLTGAVGADGHYAGSTRALRADELAGASFVVAVVANGAASAVLRNVTQTAVYANDGTTHDGRAYAF